VRKKNNKYLLSHQGTKPFGRELKAERAPIPVANFQLFVSWCLGGKTINKNLQRNVQPK